MSWEDIPGWFDFGPIYLDAVHAAPPHSSLVEVGVAFGKSLAYLARAAIDAGRNDLTIIGVDPWIIEDWLERDCKAYYEPHGGFFEAFLYNMKTYAPEEYDRVLVCKMPSLHASASALVDPPPWFVFIDGDHTYDGARADVQAWKDVIAKGGVFAGHDYGGFPGVRQAVDEEFGGRVVVKGSSWWVQM